MRTTKWTRAGIGGALLASLALLGACNQVSQSPAQPAQEISETFHDFGNYEIHFNALRTDALTADIARSYGIQRSTHRVMLNVAVLHKEADQAPRRPVDANVQVDAYNLNGQLKNLEMRRIAEGEAIYYIGEVSISGAEILVFDITVMPAGSAPLKVKFKREFYSG